MRIYMTIEVSFLRTWMIIQQESEKTCETRVEESVHSSCW